MLPIDVPPDALKVFCRSYGVRELAVFGSVLREDFRPDSDIDVLVELNPEARIGLVTLQRMRDELAQLFSRPVDLLTKSGLNRHIRDDILRSARVLHEE